MATKKQKSAPSRNSRKKTVWIVVAVLAVALICFFGIRAFIHHEQTEATYQRDKVRFAKTEKDLTAAYDAIVKAVGEPVETNTSHVCAYGALKFTRGPLNCAVAYQIVYGTKSTDTGRALTTDIYNVIHGNYGFDQNVFQTPGRLDQIQVRFSSDFSNAYKFSCGMNYRLWSKKDFNNIVTNAEGYRQYEGSLPQVAVYSVGCNRDVPKALYDLDKSTE